MRYKLVHASPILLGLLITGCRLFSLSYPAEVILPDPAAAGYPEENLTGWEIRWLAGDGDVRHQTFGNVSEVLILLPREHPAVLAAYPRTDTEPFSLFPAGHAGRAGPGTPLTLSWTDGFSADYLLELARSGVDPGMINIGRFRDTVRRRCGGNPWFLDTRRLTDELLQGDLWTYSFRSLERHEVILDFDPGRWQQSYLPAGFFESDGSARTMHLPAGTHSFLRLPEPRVLTVTVDAEGRFASIQR